MDTLTSMRVFAAVVDMGSFAAASDRLKISRAMASKYIAHLEEHLGTRLLQRTTRKLTLTESGTSYYERCIQILSDIDDAEAHAVHQTEAPRGTLRLTVPVSFGILHLGPVISEYMKQYPEVKLDLTVTDRNVDLIEEGLDLAIRIGSLPESGLIAKKIASDRVVICGAPGYFARHGIPEEPADLKDHNCLTYAYAATGDEWKLVGPDGTVHVVKVTGSLCATNGDMVKLAALSGSGVVRQPLFLVGEELRAGRLVEVLGRYKVRDIGIYAVYPSRKHLSAKVRTFIDLLAGAFSQKSEW